MCALMLSLRCMESRRIFFCRSSSGAGLEPSGDAGNNSNIPLAFTALDMLRDYVALDMLVPDVYDDLGDLSYGMLDALIAMGRYGTLEKVIAHLDGMGEARAQVIAILGKPGENAPLDALLPFLESEEGAVYEAAVRAIGRTYPEVIRSLILPRIEAVLR
jgi:HEAT repeat protein